MGLLICTLCNAVIRLTDRHGSAEGGKKRPGASAAGGDVLVGDGGESDVTG